MMIQTVREIKSLNPIPQTWKYLRGFHDISTTATKIKQIQNINDPKLDQNIDKQAKQISYCIKQAEEYYTAAREVSTATKPLLLYYGSVSLAQALVLLTNDGTSSFDHLRKVNKSERHHGLELKRFDLPNKVTNIDMVSLLKLVRCNIYNKGQNIAGFFKNFYNSLVPTSVTIPVRAVFHGKNAHQDYRQAQACADIIDINSIKKDIFNCYELSASLADCYNILIEQNIRPNICRGSSRATIDYHYKNDNGQLIDDKKTTTYYVIIDDITTNEKSLLLTYLEKVNCPFKISSEFSNSIILNHSTLITPEGKGVSFYFPDMVDDLNGDLYYIINPDSYIHETASLFIIQYCFGMLSRYHPDNWMKMINENVNFNEFTDSLMQIVERKFPNLILDQMTRVKHKFNH